MLRKPNRMIHAAPLGSSDDILVVTGYYCKLARSAGNIKQKKGTSLQTTFLADQAFLDRMAFTRFTLLFVGHASPFFCSTASSQGSLDCCSPGLHPINDHLS